MPELRTIEVVEDGPATCARVVCPFCEWVGDWGPLAAVQAGRDWAALVNHWQHAEACATAVTVHTIEVSRRGD